MYSLFDQGVDVRVASGIQTPVRAGVTFRSMTSVFLNGSGGIDHVVNDTGAPVSPRETGRGRVRYRLRDPGGWERIGA
ncbi:hypothetical protein [Cellulosimicrobium cellulans]|uniref:hypothetical protein n=1 Tax=Cellulosimicrobium cellulans TaxID=1710 RepID=UPI002404F187|nr:hypothetical protein [Cellulosimicrobium cellulans]MDF9878515.1 hypothetical protein [Cellulosimicrobium cellulans]